MDTFETQWKVIQNKGIDVLINFLMKGETAYPSVIDRDGRPKTILFSNEEYSELYTLVYKMSTLQMQGYEIYRKYEETVDAFFRDCMAPALKEAAASKDPAYYLKVLADCLEKQGVFVSWLHHIFCCLDRFHVSLNGLDNLLKCSSKIWVNEYMLPEVEIILQSISTELERDRFASLEEAAGGPGSSTNESPTNESPTNESSAVVDLVELSPSNNGSGWTYKPVIDTSVMRTVIGAIVSWSAFTNEPLNRYRNTIAASSERFYRELAIAKVDVLTFKDYLQLLRKIIAEESLRTEWLLGDVGLEIQSSITDVCIIAQLQKLLSKPDGIYSMLEKDDLDNLALCYQLISRCTTKELGLMANVFETFLKDKGMLILENKLANIKNPAMKAKGIEKATPDAVPPSFMNPDVSDFHFIKSLIDYHVKYAENLASCFNNDFQFKVKFKEAFNHIMNKNVGGVHMACYICTACDKLVRRPPTGSTGLPVTQQGVVDVCNHIVALFSYISDKDLFAEIYRTQLSKRLLGAEEPPNETERLLISTFKHVCGHSYSSKIEGMLLDVSSGMGFRAEFTEFLKTQVKQDLGIHNTPDKLKKLIYEKIVISSIPGSKPVDTKMDDTKMDDTKMDDTKMDDTKMDDTKMDDTKMDDIKLDDMNHISGDDVDISVLSDPDRLCFTVQVLTSGHWPQTTALNVRIPVVIQVAQGYFKSWYNTQTVHRKLVWNNSISQAILQATFDRHYLIVCSAAQAGLLLCFNDGKTKSAEQLSDILGMDSLNTRKYLKSLYTRFALIEKVEEDIYRVAKFTSQIRRFKLPLPIDTDTSHKPSVQEDRSHSIQACLTRIMKARKEFPHQQLVAECVSQLSMFHPSVKQIKENIEVLIEKDIIARDDKDPQIYLYSA
ncbi:cullin family protein [Gregarina niphandrodes]|uniref:Cullin family protein n=1 Tax=Gregarina niphandrodes TaxID=110365 RepID=A0A023B1R0_GRENI|nr:cullin family protein [Gregarina niphandrodes]EZG48978.1 cullin family protein [Gregarina niphandrodes]|eukprot:XP_011132067.1 cullin family protein [Gregarina niphandrodes]